MAKEHHEEGGLDEGNLTEKDKFSNVKCLPILLLRIICHILIRFIYYFCKPVLI